MTNYAPFEYQSAIDSDTIFYLFSHYQLTHTLIYKGIVLSIL